MAEGHIGELSKLFAEAAVLAVQNGSERIDAKLLKEVGWIGPSERKRQIDRVA